MTEFVDRIAGFYHETLGQNQIPVRYLVLDPGGDHQYYFRPSTTNLHQVSNMISGAGIKRRLGAASLRLCSFFPNGALMLPYVTSQRISVGETKQPDIIVVSNRIRLLDRSQGVVHTLPRSTSTGITSEIDARRFLPDEITTPELLDWNRNVPYFTEEYINGTQIGSPSENWSTFERAYENLYQLYYQTVEDSIPITEYIDQLSTELSGQPIDPDLFSDAIEILERSALPGWVRPCTIHGDMHGRNVLAQDDELYIIDWENLRSDVLIMDLFRSFLVDYYDTRDITPFIHMFDSNNDIYACVQRFARINGTVMWGDNDWYPGLILLAALKSLDRNTQHSPMWNCSLELLTKLVNHDPI